MSDFPIDEPDPSPDEPPLRRPEVRDVLAFSDREGGFAYRRGEVIVRGLRAARRLVQLADSPAERILPDPDDAGPERIAPEDLDDPGFAARLADEEIPQLYRTTGVREPLALIDRLRSEQFAAQPNHVFLAHSCGPACPPHPALANAALALWANPLSANPLSANPLSANPLSANPLSANPLSANGALVNTATPAVRPVVPLRKTVVTRPLRIVVLDTGLPGDVVTDEFDAFGDAVIKNYEPGPLKPRRPRIDGELDEPDGDIEVGDDDQGQPITYPSDGYLDPAAGHGVFIAGIIESLAPGCAIGVKKVVMPLGDTDEVAVAEAIGVIATSMDGPNAMPTIVTMSFGGQVLDQPNVLRKAISDARAKGVVFIASAGNDGVCARQYPAAFPDVIAVGGLGPWGPAPWSNYGDWVDACAPATDLISWFFDGFDGEFPTVNTQDADHFSGAAVWSGTSFSVPVVAAKIAVEYAVGRGADSQGVVGPISLEAAAERVVAGPYQTRIPCLGTVVTI